MTNLLWAQSTQVEIHSPDKKISFSLSLLPQGHLQYSVLFRHQPVIDASLLGLTVDDVPVCEGSSFGTIQKQIIDKSYPWRGVHSTAVNHCRDAKINITGKGGVASFSIEVRVFNDGVAFRYLIPHKGKSTVNADHTEFTLPAGSAVWRQGDIHAYEGKYQHQQIEDVRQGQRVGPPLTIQLPAGLGYAAITEGGLTDFAGMSLLAEGNRKFVAVLAGPTHLSGDIETPWRIVEIGPDLNTLVNCDIIQDVSPPMDKTLFPDGFATNWIKPGKSAWSWLAGNGGVTFDNMKRFSKWAGELGFRYNLVDEGWYKWHEGNKDQWDLLKELVQYADSQGVKIWVWKAYPDRNGIPGLKTPKARMAFFKKCKEAGVAGLKIDFFDAESQQVIDFYQAALRDAAKLHLMLDFHGADKPTGQMRTWPNEMTREGIRGLENGSDWPVHNTTLPFTRFLAGHADYTPLSFRSIAKGTTWAHQVASMTIFTSSFMCLAVNPETLLDNPCRKMVESVPVTWDQTIVLPQSKIGQLALFARRKGKTWYLAAMNGDSARTCKVDLSFLGHGKYHAVMLEDQQGKKDTVRIVSKKVKAKSTLVIQLDAGGGFVGRFVK
jgi:alpha-glucosidase